MMLHIDKIQRGRLIRAARIRRELWGKQVLEAIDWPGLVGLPYSLQKLIIAQLREMTQAIESGEMIPEEPGDGGECYCSFYRKWLLPCKHLWLAEASWGCVLTDDMWAQWRYRFAAVDGGENTGLEFYEERHLEAAGVRWRDEQVIGAPQRRRLEVSKGL